MKATAYITILLSLLTLWTPVEASRRRSAGRRERGQIFNPALKRVGADAQINLTTRSQKPSNSGNGSATSSSSNLESPQSNSNGAGTGLANNGATGNTGNNSTQNTQKPEGQDAPKRNKPDKKKGSNRGLGANGVSFGLWWPVCVFVDGPDANSQIAEMVKMSADCRVNLVPYVRTVTVPDPNNPEQLNSLQSQSCNIKEGGIAGKGSSLVLTNRSSTVADKMCGSEETVNGVTRPTTNVAGCNQLANGASEETKNRAKRHKGNGDGFGGVSDSEVAVGIVDSQGYYSGAVYSHETMGHGQMGWPNGKKAGNGIGDPNDDQDSSGDHQHGGGYTGIGCAQMRASAIPDPEGFHKFYSSKTKYYSHREDKKMPLGEKIWKTFKDGPQIDGQITNSGSGFFWGTQSAAAPQGSNMGSANAGHKKARGGKSLAGRIAGGRNSGGANRGDGGGDDSLANQVSGGSSGGAGDPNSTLVANRDKSALGNSGGLVLDTNYLDGFNSNESNSGGFSEGSSISVVSRGLAFADVSKVGDPEPNWDPNYLNKSKKTRKKNGEKRPIRRWDISKDQSRSR